MSELIGRNTAEKIWNYFISKGFTKQGAAGTMGNLDHESGLQPNNLQNSRNSTLGSDTYYTSAVNNQTYSKNEFINDRAGYGLAQWTYYTRKRGLYEITVEQGLSIADLKGQLDFLIKELETGYKSLLNLLKTTNSVDEASDAFLKQFEAPAILDYKGRRETSWIYYNRYSDGMPINEDPDEIIPDECEYKTYIVQIGDSWWKIAANKLGSGTKMYELAEFNGKTTKTALRPGDVIKLPEIRDEIKEAESKAEPVVIPDTNLYISYEVKIGDSWWKIAAKHLGSGTKMAELAKYNGRNTSSILHIGESIKIPIIKSTTDEAVSIKAFTLYTVKKNDSWWRIAANEMGSGTKMNELAKFNGKTTNDIIHPGNVIKIPKE